LFADQACLCDVALVAAPARISDWDFFISYTQTDRAWAEWIAWLLEEDGYRVLLQAWDFVVGGNWLQSMHEGTAKAARTIAVLSEAYLRSVYGQAEWQAAWKQDPDGEQRKLLVFRVENCDRSGLLAGLTGIDIFGVDETQARSRVRSSVATAIRGRAKPDRPPRFPSSGRAVTTQARFPGSLPSVFGVPSRNRTFVGRADDLAEVARIFANGLSVVVQVLHGIGRGRKVSTGGGIRACICESIRAGVVGGIR
jgi:TIR domain